MASQSMNGMPESRRRILEAALATVRDAGVSRATIDRVAAKSGCAKGLVHYHFGTKDKLFSQALGLLSARRDRDWHRAFAHDSPAEVIAKTWSRIQTEGQDGTLRALVSYYGAGDFWATEAVKESTTRFATTIRREVDELLERMELEPTLPRDQIGWLLSSIVQGTALQLAAGADESVLEEAYAAAWLGIFSLTKPIAQRRPR